MNSAQIVFAVITGILGLIVIIGNWLGVIHSKKTGKNFSCIPFLGGVLVALCIAATPCRRFFWLGLILDIGTWSDLIGLPFLIKQIILRNKDE